MFHWLKLSAWHPHQFAFCWNIRRPAWCWPQALETLHAWGCNMKKHMWRTCNHLWSEPEFHPELVDASPCLRYSIQSQFHLFRDDCVDDLYPTLNERLLFRPFTLGRCLDSSRVENGQGRGQFAARAWRIALTIPAWESRVAGVRNKPWDGGMVNYFAAKKDSESQGKEGVRDLLRNLGRKCDEEVNTCLANG